MIDNSIEEIADVFGMSRQLVFSGGAAEKKPAIFARSFEFRAQEGRFCARNVNSVRPPQDTLGKTPHKLLTYEIFLLNLQGLEQ